MKRHVGKLMRFVATLFNIHSYKKPVKRADDANASSHHHYKERLLKKKSRIKVTSLQGLIFVQFFFFFGKSSHMNILFFFNRVKEISVNLELFFTSCLKVETYYVIYCNIVKRFFSSKRRKKNNLNFV